MRAKRKTIDRNVLVDMANRRIKLSTEVGGDRLQRKTIVDFTRDVLLDGNSYRGFQYLEPPKQLDDGKFYDDTKVRFN